MSWRWLACRSVETAWLVKCASGFFPSLDENCWSRSCWARAIVSRTTSFTRFCTAVELPSEKWRSSAFVRCPESGLKTWSSC